MTQVCIPITAEAVEKAIADLREAEKHVDLVELRIDYIKGINEKKLKKLLESRKKKAIVACRPNSLEENKRLNLLKKAVELNAEFVDIEIESGQEAVIDLISNKKNTKVIVSYHNKKDTPWLDELQKKYEEIKKLNPDLVKIVTNASSINDNFIIFELLKGKTDLVAFCMDLRGQISRILAPKYGSKITFASLMEGKESASGQISIEEMKNLYNINSINEKTNVLGVIGEFAENSMSKYMHNSSFKEKNLDFAYIPFKTRKEELKDFIKNFRKFDFKGSSVTVPHKVEIIKCLDEIDETAKQIGAVNTIANKNGKLVGFNTDYYGAIEALKEKLDLSRKKVLVIGAGGAARAIIYGLKKENAIITIANRTLENAKKLAKEFNVKHAHISKIKDCVIDNEIIINTTSVGMKPKVNESIINENDLASCKTVMDIVYKPTETKLVKMARKAKCNVITGDRMLVHQAIVQFKLWTSQDPNFKSMETALLEQIRKGG